ncbi:MAG: hypothetical protein ACTHZ9_00495 [Leucobacter sp.]
MSDTPGSGKENEEYEDFRDTLFVSREVHDDETVVVPRAEREDDEHTVVVDRDATIAVSGRKLGTSTDIPTPPLPGSIPPSDTPPAATTPRTETLELDAVLGPPPQSSAVLPDAMRDGLPSTSRANARFRIATVVGFGVAVVISAVGLWYVVPLILR